METLHGTCPNCCSVVKPMINPNSETTLDVRFSYSIRLISLKIGDGSQHWFTTLSLMSLHHNHAHSLFHWFTGWWSSVCPIFLGPESAKRNHETRQHLQSGVIKHDNGKSPINGGFSMGTSSTTRICSIAMFHYQRVNPKLMAFPHLPSSFNSISVLAAPSNGSRWGASSPYTFAPVAWDGTCSGTYPSADPRGRRCTANLAKKQRPLDSRRSRPYLPFFHVTFRMFQRFHSTIARIAIGYTLWLWLTVRHGIAMAHRNRWFSQRSKPPFTCGFFFHA